MALMPEDVLNKNFTATQFRRGYDEQEVDDFLDEVVVELRRLSAELEDCRSGKGAVAATVSDAKPAAVPAVDGRAGATRSAEAGSADKDAAAKVAAARSQAEQAEKEAAARIAKAKADAERAEAEAAQRVKAAGESAAKAVAPGAAGPAVAVSAAPPAAAAAGATDAQSAAGVLALAQKLHDEHVAEGESTRDRLISEGQAQHDTVVGEAQARHDELLATGQAQHDKLITDAQERSHEMIAEAQDKKQALLDGLMRERDQLNRSVEELRTFERDYRARLKSYLENQLADLESTGLAPAAVSDSHNASADGLGQQV